MKSRSDFPVEPFGFSVESIWGGGATTASTEPDSDRDVEEQRELRSKLSGRPFVHRAQHSSIQSPSIPLIGQGRVRESIADDRLPLRQCGFDDVIDMLAPGRKNEVGFRFGGDRFRRIVEQDTTQTFGEQCPTRFSRVQHIQTLCAQTLTQPSSLSRFSASFTTFQCDEDAPRLS